MVESDRGEREGKAMGWDDHAATHGERLDSSGKSRVVEAAEPSAIIRKTKT